jgi:FAD/FMN-containing dehydrogenase
MTGIGVTATSPHVDTVNAGVSVVVSSAQTIENGQTVTFTGSSRSASVTGNVLINSHGTSDVTLTLNLDNILTVE